MEAEASHALGVAYHELGDDNTAVTHHRTELELSHRLGLTHLQVSVGIHNFRVAESQNTS